MHLIHQLKLFTSQNLELCDNRLNPINLGNNLIIKNTVFSTLTALFLQLRALILNGNKCIYLVCYEYALSVYFQILILHLLDLHHLWFRKQFVSI